MGVRVKLRFDRLGHVLNALDASGGMIVTGDRAGFISVWDAEDRENGHLTLHVDAMNMVHLETSSVVDCVARCAPCRVGGRGR